MYWLGYVQCAVCFYTHTYDVFMWGRGSCGSGYMCSSVYGLFCHTHGYGCPFLFILCCTCWCCYMMFTVCDILPPSCPTHITKHTGGTAQQAPPPSLWTPATTPPSAPSHSPPRSTFPIRPMQHHCSFLLPLHCWLLMDSWCP